jgi:hypothetical protein
MRFTLANVADAVSRSSTYVFSHWFKNVVQHVDSTAPDGQIQTRHAKTHQIGRTGSHERVSLAANELFEIKMFAPKRMNDAQGIHFETSAKRE